jgi:hypothetical protein
MQLPAEPLKALKEPSQAHCADHSHFTQGCPVCRQARANFEPYPVRASRPVTRSYGFTDDLTQAKLDALDADEDDSLSLVVLRFVLRLIWPFSRII